MTKEMQIKPKTDMARLLLNSAIIVSLFKNPTLMEHICGPFTLPIAQKQHLIFYIIFIQVLRICYKHLAHFSAKVPLLKWMPSYFSELLVVKYLLVLTLKFFLIFEQSHRKKFYLHSFFQEAIILVTAILFDCLHKQNIKEAGELLLIDGLHRLSLVYELTQTFCPNLILYYIVTNLLVFVMAQVESQQRYGNKESLYVKHDVYRFMFTSALFFGLSSVAQLFNYNFKMLVAFGACLKLIVSSLHSYNDSNYLSALNSLLLCCGVLASIELAFIWLPFSLLQT